MPQTEVLILTRNGKPHFFTFVFHLRKTREAFLFKYPEEGPPLNSIEIEIDEVPKGIKDADQHVVHISTNDVREPGTCYICRYPATDYEAALETAKYWSRFNLMYLETGKVSTEPEDVLGLVLDREIDCFQLD